MRLVHVCLYLEHKSGELFVKRVNYLVTGNSRQRRHGHFKEAFQKRLNAEVIKSRAEEHGAELATAHLLDIKLIACAVKKLNIVRERLTKSGAYELIELFGLIERTLYRLYLVLTTVKLVECEYLTLFTVVNALEVDAAADRPVHWIGADAELVFQLLHEVIGTAGLTVELIYKCKDRDIAHCAYLKKLSRLRLNALCGIDDHNCRVSRHKGTVGVLGKVLVTGRVEYIYAVTLVLKLHDRRAYGYTTLLFKLHPVGHGVPCGGLALNRARKLYRTAVEQELFG